MSFESKAICSEFEASFSPFAQHEMEDLFKNAMKKLPVPFDPENSIHKAIFTKFVNTYGTHYANQIVLGGKRVLETSMTSR